MLAGSSQCSCTFLRSQRGLHAPARECCSPRVSPSSAGDGCRLFLGSRLTLHIWFSDSGLFRCPCSSPGWWPNSSLSVESFVWESPLLPLTVTDLGFVCGIECWVRAGFCPSASGLQLAIAFCEKGVWKAGSVSGPQKSLFQASCVAPSSSLSWAFWWGGAIEGRFLWCLGVQGVYTLRQRPQSLKQFLTF